MKCNQLHNKPGTYCSRSCSNSRGPRSEETKQKIREAVLAKPTGIALLKRGGNHLKGSQRAPRVVKTCPTCNTEFEQRLSATAVYCSTKCVRRGGMREGSGRAKTGWYKGIYCGSTYELAFLIWHLDHNLKIERSTDVFEYTYDGKTHKYYPDFVVDSQNYEIKGRMVDADYAKLQASNAILVDSNKMKLFIQYVVTNYKVGKSSLWKLYDTNKLPFEYSCYNCQSVFHTHKERTTETKFCSQPCAAKFNRLQAKWYK